MGLTYQKGCAMARNELTKSAIEIAALVRRKAVERTDKELAECIGIDPSTLCRFKAEHLDKFCAYLDELGLTVTEKGLNQISDAELEALKLFASKGLAEFGQ